MIIARKEVGREVAGGDKEKHDVIFENLQERLGLYADSLNYMYFKRSWNGRVLSH